MAPFALPAYENGAAQWHGSVTEAKKAKDKKNN